MKLSVGHYAQRKRIRNSSACWALFNICITLYLIIIQFAFMFWNRDRKARAMVTSSRMKSMTDDSTTIRFAPEISSSHEGLYTVPKDWNQLYASRAGHKGYKYKYPVKCLANRHLAHTDEGCISSPKLVSTSMTYAEVSKQSAITCVVEKVWKVRTLISSSFKEASSKVW